MNGDGGLVGCLVDRVSTRLPHRTGTAGRTFDEDDILIVTRATLVDLSKKAAFDLVLGSLLGLLEELSRPFTSVAAHPAHVLQSERYLLALLADCCSAKWSSVSGGREHDRASLPPPSSLDESLVNRLLDALRQLLEPIPDQYILPAQALLDPVSERNVRVPRPELQPTHKGDGHLPEADCLDACLADFDSHIKTIVEFLTASSWSITFAYVRNTVYSIRTTSFADASSEPPTSTQDAEKSALVVMRLLSFFWVDGPRLGLIIQEICSSYLHFRKTCQNTVAVAVPLLIARWIDRYPDQFVRLHLLRKRLDGGADTLFDMTQAGVDSGKRKAVLYPLQITLLLLLPDVFEVASNMREVKSGSVAKKVACLDGLRKALRNGNERAGYCLVTLLRVARHFDIESDSALVSYAMDVQDEIRDAIFSHSLSSPSPPHVDQDIITGAFVSLAHLNFNGNIASLVKTCIAPSAPDSFKIAVVQSCTYFARQPHSAGFNELLSEAVPFMRSLFEEQYFNGVMAQGSPAEGNLNLVCAILQFLNVFPQPLFDELFHSTLERGFVKPFLFCVFSPNTSIRHLAGEISERLLFDASSDTPTIDAGDQFDTRDLRSDLWLQSSKAVLDLSERIGAQGEISDIEALHGLLRARLTLLRAIPGLAELSDDSPDLAASSIKLETTLLVSLCTANVETCQILTTCIRLALEASSLSGTPREPSKPLSSMLRNAAAYHELSSPAFRFTGMVAFQKRMRGLLRRMQHPTVGILNAWEIAFGRWVHLAREVSTSTIDAVEDKVLSEWRNFSGFLASLGGICTADQGTASDESTLGELRWIDRLSAKADHSEEPLLTRFLRLSIQLLGCPNAKVREAMRDVLSNEVSPVLYHALFRALESELEVLLSRALPPADRGQDGEIVFAEQAASLLKAMVERLETPSDLGAASSVHLGVLTLSFVEFIDGAPEGADTLRVKIRVCNLCEAVTKRKEDLNLRDDVRIRNQLLEYIFGWIARPHSIKQDRKMISGVRQDEMRRIQRDLDKACLRSLAQLTFRLPLQPPESQTDAELSELKSQMFHTYFNRFLSLLNYETHETGRREFSPNASIRDDVTPHPDLVITILSNLLSANIDVGLKHSLNIGYHENIEIRTAFVKVLYNILIQGTEFSSLTDSAIGEKYEELLKLLTTDLSLAVALSAICPASEVDELTVCLLTIFEQRGLIFDLFQALIQNEIEQTENEAEILRRTCIATKMLSIYARWKGVAYLRSTLQKVLERLMLTSQDLNLELDPARVRTQEELQKNAIQLQIVAKVFMDDICASAPNFPPSFRNICNIISEAVSPHFPNAKYTAVGAFVFLRFICPAIVAPEAEGLVSVAPTKEMRRGLLLIAKVIQNLANNVLFGTKEPYMFPLNPFLVQNIHLVTGFLREISVPSENAVSPVDTGLLDFGSCVALHRYIYDHWDNLRQNLVSRGRREYAVSSTELSRGASPILEPLRNLITNLGPPPLAISWNRPQISHNAPPLYSRFQSFMLRNALKGTESFLTSQAVYDGGESKDGLSIVCVILRHIETDHIDYDTLLYCYLKIASRLWNEPFGLFIDATCYNGRSEPPDEFFTTLDLLTPSELSQNLSRIYVYNMNSAFKRCFRRLLRISTRNENSIFHPKNVGYHLIGSLQDLQAHFLLSQLHLPKETISVVTDTRYMFQPVTRLSKSKGKVEVVIKVGSQFVQVTTVKKQEVLSGFRLSSTVNDIFRLGEIEESATTIQADDEHAFGLRADAGKIVMCFTSAKKADVLQTIRGAKGRYGKDSRTHKPLERLVRPQDVPGTMLNLALTNLAGPDHVLRLASYNLLGALCRAFEFGAVERLVCSRDLSVPAEPARFIVNISKELARSEPQLTSDFLTEFFVSWDSFPEDQRPLSLEYMAPWLSGLRSNVLTSEVDGEKGREKVANLFRKLIDLALLDQSLGHALEHYVWPKIAEEELLLEIFLDELIKSSLSYGAPAETVETISSVMVGLGTISLRGKIFSRLRRVLNRSSLRPTRFLPDNAVWAEICVLLQFCLALSFDCGVQSQMFLPEVFHIVTMLANTGGQDVRMLVYRLLVNTIHAACSSFALDDVRLAKLRASLDSLSEPRGELFSLSPLLARDGGTAPASQDSGSTLSATENLAAALFDICSTAAPSVDLGNAWRSRWMSLVASTAFQNNPAVQPRAFTVMGYLAREEVDDDLLYQVLVALRNSVHQFGDDGNSEMLVSIITSLSKMMTKLPSASRYGLQLFWLAMSLVRLVPSGLFNCTAQFLEAILNNIGTIGNIRGDKMVPLLLQSRAQLEEAAVPLDDAYGIHFDDETFHFAVCACLVRGLTDTVTRPTATRLLSCFLEMTTWIPSSAPGSPTHAVHGSPYLALILARCMGREDLKDSLWWADIESDEIGKMVPTRGVQHLDNIKDQDLLLLSAIEMVDFGQLEDAAQARSLQWLNRLALDRPIVFADLCGAMPSILDDVLLHGQEIASLEAAHSLLQTLTSDSRFSTAMGSIHSLKALLDRLGFSGLWRYHSQGSKSQVKHECFKLTDKLIELIVI